jgi:hypothetical protein
MCRAARSSGDSNAIDAYDALFGATAMDVEAYELVQVYHALNELLEAVWSQTLANSHDHPLGGARILHGRLRGNRV